jgi:hypothetical protein
MPTLAQCRRLTCRYWAFGPHCPDVTPGGRNDCKFAHSDTGTLATTHDQPGTCLAWSRDGHCFAAFGTGAMRCPYEHRDTGVTGLYQGGKFLSWPQSPVSLINIVIALSEPEKEIADAAHAAGFDTFNHEALYDLIWAVKRQAIHMARDNPAPAHRRSPAPPHPIYPDRFRADGFRDNTRAQRPFKNAKRKRANERESPPPMHEVPPLMRRGKAKPAMMGNYLVTKPGETSKKRRKTNGGGKVEGVIPINPLIDKLLKVKNLVKSGDGNAKKSLAEMKVVFDQHWTAYYSSTEAQTMMQGFANNLIALVDGIEICKSDVDTIISWVEGKTKENPVVNAES